MQQLGISSIALRGVVGGSTAWLTTKGAPHEQIAFLQEELGYSVDQVSAKLAVV